MMKFFRKHNKELLAIFMAMLMIVFIGGSALQGMLTPSLNRVVATSALGDISYLDQQEARATTDVLDRMGEPWRSPLRTPQPLDVVDWILLSREAKKIGTQVELAAIRSTITPDQLDTVSRQLSVKPAAILHALQEIRSIQQTALTVGAGSVPSEAEIQSAARDVLEKVKINALLLPAEAFVDDTRTFSDEEMQAQFEAYRDKEPSGGLNFGYYQQPSIRVQFIQIDRDKIAEELTIPNLERRAKKYYDEHRETDRAFKNPNTLPVVPDGPLPDPYLSWEEAREAAKLAVRKQQADVIAKKLANWLISFASEPWVIADRADNGYKVVPESAKDLDSYRNMLKKLPPSIAYPDAVQEWRSNFFTQESANEVALIGATFFLPERSTPRPFSELAFKNQFIVPDISGDDIGNTAEYVAPFQTYPFPVENRLTGSLFVFRVIEGRDGYPAESLDEVRDAVVADLRLKKAYDIAHGRAKGLLGCEPEKTLTSIYSEDKELTALKDVPDRPGVNYYAPEPFARTPQYLAAEGRPADGVMVFGGVGRLPNDVVDALFGLEFTESHKDVYELPDRASILVAEWVKTQRADDESYLALHKQLSTRIAQRRFSDMVGDWLNPEQIQARNEFKLIEP